MTELIIKYNGDIEKVAKELGAIVEILDYMFAIMTIEPEKIPQLMEYPEVEFAEFSKYLGYVSIAADSSCITPVQENTSYNLTGEGVIAGIIDSGIDYTHPAFLDENGNTRILHIWDQNIEGSPPEGFSLGSEYNAEQINAAINAPTAGERMALLPHEDTMGHGTAVAGIAAGFDKSGEFKGVATKASIIAVKLAVYERFNYSMTRTTDLMRGIRYIIDKAKELNMPAVINLSFGTNNGAHNSESLFEQFIDNVSNEWRLNIIVATGNEGMSGHHYSGIIDNGEVRDIEFTVAPGLNTIAIIMTKLFADKMTFEIIAPDGRSTGPARGSGYNEEFIIGANKISIIEGQPTSFYSDPVNYFEFSGIDGKDITASVWKIRITANQIISGEFDMWLPITELVGIKTAFLSANADYSLTLPATAKTVISVSGYNPTDGRYADFSGRGVIFSDSYIKPDIAAPAVSIEAPLSGGGYGVFTGTSFAAPFVTGSAILLMEWGILEGNDTTLYGQRVKAYLRSGAQRIKGIDYPNELWGFGKLCLKDTLDMLKQYSDIFGDTYHRPNQPGTIYTSNFQPNVQTQEIINRDSITDNLAGYDHINDLFSSIIVKDGENHAINEDYEDIIILYSPGSEEEIASIPGIKISRIMANRYIMAHIPHENMHEVHQMLKDILWEDIVVLGPLDRISMEVSGITAVQNQPYLNLRGQGVLIGIVDTGIDYNNNVFIKEDGTSKIQFLWDQSISGTPPVSFSYGAEFNNEDMNNAIANPNPKSIVPSTDEVGHGTFMACLAAGNKDGEGNTGAAPDSDLIVVKLKNAKQIYLNNHSIPDGREAYQSSDVMQAVGYVYQKAIELNKPCVICLGLGSNDGAHDGSSFFERYLSDIAIINEVAVVAAVGNEGSSAAHVTGRITNNQQPQSIELNVGEAETGFLINLWAFAPDRISISIESPLGGTVHRVPFASDETQRVEFVLEQSIIELTYVYPNSKNGSEAVYVNFKKPTPGIWKINIYGDMVLDGRFHAWLPINDFTSPGTAFLSPDVNNTAVIPATASNVISVGAYNALDKSIYVNSSRGPSIQNKQCPDLCAPGVNVTGIYPNNSYGIMSGTSVAAAITAGAAALIMEWGVVKRNDTNLNSIKVKTYLVQGAEQRPATLYPDSLWGYGEMNLMQSFERIRDNFYFGG